MVVLLFNKEDEAFNVVSHLDLFMELTIHFLKKKKIFVKIICPRGIWMSPICYCLFQNESKWILIIHFEVMSVVQSSLRGVKLIFNYIILVKVNYEKKVSFITKFLRNLNKLKDIYKWKSLAMSRAEIAQLVSKFRSGPDRIFLMWPQGGTWCDPGRNHIGLW